MAMPNTRLPTISIIIPAYNEAARIETSIRRVEKLSRAWKSLKTEILVVNDGSDDGTFDILERYKHRVSVIHHDRNRGVGAALRTGFSAASGDILVRQDADLEYPPEEMIALIEPLIHGKADAVYGFRKPRDHRSTSSKPYHWGGMLLIMICNLFYGFRVKDFITAAKAFRRPMLAKMKLVSNGFEIESEMTAKIVRLGYTLICVPYSYKARSFKEGKKIRWHHAFPILYDLVYWRFAKLL